MRLNQSLLFWRLIGDIRRKWRCRWTRWRLDVGAEGRAGESCTRGKNGGNVWSLHVINISGWKHVLMSLIPCVSARVSTSCMNTVCVLISCVCPLFFWLCRWKTSSQFLSIKGGFMVSGFLPVGHTWPQVSIVVVVLLFNWFSFNDWEDQCVCCCHCFIF